jgi:hypothetical protein
MSNKLFLLMIALVTAVTVQAQTYEIRALNKGNGVVGVEVRVTSGALPTTADYVTDLVFGVRWLASYNVDLESTLTTNYHIAKSGSRKSQGAWHYQAFYADNTPFLFPANWILNDWVEILSVRNTMTGTGVGTFEVVQAGFDVTTEPNVGVSLTDFTPAVTGSATLVPLPVNLTRFDVKARQRQIDLQWATDHEENAKGFEVERAEQSNPANFKRLGAVVSKGTAGGKYEWTDRNVVGGVNYYYRLKQIDLDERYRYSDIKMASLDEQGNNSIQLWPNPVEKELQVTFDGSIQASQLLIRITDARGRVVMLKDYHLGTGRKITFNVVPLMQGLYFLSVENGKTILAMKSFFKQ